MEMQRRERAVAPRRLRFGFAFEGIFREHMVVKGRNRDTAWFAMTDEDWPAIKRRHGALARPDEFRRRGAAEGSLKEAMAAAKLGGV